MPRTIEHEIEVAATPERAFAAIVTPSAIRTWWSAARAIVMPRTGGTYAVVWGADEDDPDYTTVARIAAYEPGSRLELDRYAYSSKFGPLPFEAEMNTTFHVEPADAGARLRVVQDGVPDDPVADAFFAGCEKGWRDTFAALREFLDATQA